MQNVNNDGVEKTVFQQQYSKAQLQAYIEFQVQLLQHRHRYDEFCTMKISFQITSKEYSTTY
jgi:hypothetical protein